MSTPQESKTAGALMWLIGGVQDAQNPASSRNRYVRVLATFASVGVARVATAVLGLVTIPIVLDAVGRQRYGIFATVLSAAAVLSVTDFGLGSGLLTEVASARARQASEMLQALVSTAFFLSAAIAVLLGLLTLAAVETLPWTGMLNVDSGQLASEGKWTAAALALGFAFGLPFSTAGHVRSAYQQGFINGLATAGGSAFGFAALLVAVSLALPLPALAVCVAGGTASGMFGNWLALVIRSPTSRPRTKLISRTAAAPLLRTGSLFFTLQVAGAVAFSSDNIVAAQVLGIDEVTDYAVPFRLFATISGFVTIATSAMWPAYAEAIAKGDTQWARRALSRCTRVLVLVSALAAVCLVPLSPSILRLWVGSDVRTDGRLLVGLGVWLVLSAYGHSVAAFLAASRVVAFQAVTAVAMAMANIVLSVLLAREIGVAGLIWGTVLSYFVCTATPYFFFLRRVSQRVPWQPPAQV